MASKRTPASRRQGIRDIAGGSVDVGDGGGMPDDAPGSEIVDSARTALLRDLAALNVYDGFLADKKMLLRLMQAFLDGGLSEEQLRVLDETLIPKQLAVSMALADAQRLQIASIQHQRIQTQVET